ncbi:hypothetical protein M8A51_13300 [Schlegelella sp. S2-27]|uniref:Uncharacterized protein n=1 Tax=Caldimonas mangrovi TaxID=2944811 RepID=A0ABT0YP41_9BURK|nr:hypothetical protein [Caldimonas mangrovi]MCM5680505.1 hypothetical protein [Caldimonas mangrovi]
MKDHKPGNAVHRVMALVSAAFLTGCGTTAALDPDASGPAEDESVIVLGVQPANYRVMLFPGTVSAGKFTQDTWSGAAINGVPKDGYIVAKAKAGQVLGLVSVQATKDGGHFGTAFNACGGRPALTFEVPKSKVLYLVDVEYVPHAVSLFVHYTHRFAAAEHHLRTRFPRIQGPMQQHAFQALPTTASCGGTVTIPVYIGR